MNYCYVNYFLVRCAANSIHDGDWVGVRLEFVEIWFNAFEVKPGRGKKEMSTNSSLTPPLMLI
jgi:hypothetical protein